MAQLKAETIAVYEELSRLIKEQRIAETVPICDNCNIVFILFINSFKNRA